VAGTVSLYRGTPQLTLADVRDMILVAAQPEPTVSALLPLNQLGPQDQGRQVRVRGDVVALEGLSGGVKATLDDGSAQVALLLWDRVHQALSDPRGLDVGAEVEVDGEVDIYNDVLEIVPRSEEDVRCDDHTRSAAVAMGGRRRSGARGRGPDRSGARRSGRA